MVIDKTTGRGCALSIASKPIIRKLIAEGIVGKPIYRKPRKDRYDVLTVAEYGKILYVMSKRGGEPWDTPLWTPSFIDAEIWERAVSRFCLYELDRNVENYLLPEMEDYLQSIPDTELVSIVRDFLIEHGVINVPISQRAGKTYYFNDIETYCLDNGKMFPCETRQKFNIFKVRGETCFNMNVWRKAVSQFKVGMALNECIGIFLKTELTHNVPQEPSPIDRLVQYITPPAFERVPENNDESTFDYIRVTVCLPRYQFNSWNDLKNEVQKYQRETYERVVQRVENDRQFKKYGVPIGSLKLSNVTLLHDFSMEFIFELKADSSVE